MKKGFIIAIDGPVASGKGTIAKKIAQKINALNFNSGGVYRAYASKLVNKNILPSDQDLIKKNLVPGEVDIELNENSYDEFEIKLGGKDVTESLFQPEISMAASNFGKSRDFVEFINLELRRIVKKYESLGLGIIMEGRQIGTDVFPDADLKLFLTADLKVRAKRRFDQYNSKQINKSFEEVLEETRLRDEQDLNRGFGALPKNPEKLGYVIIDNSSMNESDTLNTILEILEREKIWQKN